MIIRREIMAALIVGCLWRPGFASEPVAAEIEVLIQAVASSGCEFERNGNRYDAAAAADHLRLKYRRGKRYAASTEKFIDRLASKSFFTGRQYLMLCPGENEQTANAWLHVALNAQRHAD